MDKVVNEGSQWVKNMQQMSKRYETNKGCKRARTKWTFKTRWRTKTNLYINTIKLTLVHKNISNSTNKIIVCVYVWARVCVCVCVCNTTKLWKNYKFKMSFFMIRNGQFLRAWKVSQSHCIWMSARPIHVAFHSYWFTLEVVCCCCEEIW